jgi:hypothetical protein
MRQLLNTLAWAQACIAFPLYVVWTWHGSGATFLVAVFMGLFWAAVWHALPKSVTGWK